MVRRRLKIILFLCAFIMAVILTECLYFHHILSDDSSHSNSDALIVFSGAYARIQKGYELAKSGYADYLVISPETRNRLEFYERKHSLPQSVRHIIEDKARTTFENAVYTSKIIKEKGFKSVILVTSIDHLPRSYFYLKFFLLGSGVEIQAYGVESNLIHGEDWFKSSAGLKLIYNEMVEFWGGLAELVIYKVTGTLPRNHPSDSKIVQHLKSLLLFDVP